ncbi:uncharacterized protein LOC126964953 [Leptidea sinapis]|uniref:uncharacterized protein LOC126964953 n=1 Tax=Leptidea sinapis TaxID=189913 RepID=UPI0021C29992|nr:uncharacterized protein LOC126964953 [Leptidea sinapis]
MAQKYILFLITAALLQLEVSSRPATNESTQTVDIIPNETVELNVADKERSIFYEPEINDKVESQSARDIVNKIKVINDGLKKPYRPQINFNNPQSGEVVAIDGENLKKILDAIALGKLQSKSESVSQYESNIIQQKEEEKFKRFLDSRALRAEANINSAMMPTMPIPYITSMPVVVMPHNLDGYNRHYTVNNNLKYNTNNEIYQTRQEPSFPSFTSFLQWPFASVFPFIIKDPFLTFSQGGGFNNLFEYGQNADVCTRKQKSERDEDENENENSIFLTPSDGTMNTRRARGLRKRNIPNGSPSQKLESGKKAKKVYVTRPVSTKKTTKKPYIVEEVEEVKNEDVEGDLKFPFGGFSFFGDKRPVAPSPGFFINRLRVRKGGVAIAGPGGVATAGRGGTAIVGAGGLAYTQPGGLAVAGPSARVVALSSDVDLNSFVSRLQKDQNESIPIAKQPIREGKLVATGPVVYYHPIEQTRSNGPEESSLIPKPEYYKFDENGFLKTEDEDKDSEYHLYLSPSALAVSGLKGTAVANPISQVVVRRGQTVSIAYKPKATAIVGAGGIAHADSTQYLPFYGGAKGQYLEIKKDIKGSILSEKIVPEDMISNENIIKNSEGNIQSKVLAANLQNLKTYSTNLIKLHNLGRKLGFLGNTEKSRFKSQLMSLSEAASNAIKIIDEIGDDVDSLFKQTNPATSQIKNYDDDVGEEGVSVGADEPQQDYIMDGANIAEAKPIGLAVVGENGLAASRPIANAVASTGVAIAQPIATAIAGIDPSLLGINFPENYNQQSGRTNKERLYKSINIAS